MLEWCGEEMVSALWFGSQAKRDTAATICGVTLAAVVPRQSRESRQASPRQTTYAKYLRKSGMRHETTVVRRRGEACIHLQAQDGDVGRGGLRVMLSLFLKLSMLNGVALNKVYVVASRDHQYMAQ
jgi:hypothetical protein